MISIIYDIIFDFPFGTWQATPLKLSILSLNKCRRWLLFVTPSENLNNTIINLLETSTNSSSKVYHLILYRINQKKSCWQISNTWKKCIDPLKDNSVVVENNLNRWSVNKLGNRWKEIKEMFKLKHWRKENYLSLIKDPLLKGREKNLEIKIRSWDFRFLVSKKWSIIWSLLSKAKNTKILTLKDKSKKWNLSIKRFPSSMKTLKKP